jgi:hypothetical protein
MQSYIFWALLGIVGYSFTTLFVKLAERSAGVSNKRSFVPLSSRSLPSALMSI